MEQIFLVSVAAPFTGLAVAAEDKNPMFGQATTIFLASTCGSQI